MMRLPGGSLIKFFVLTYAVTWTCFVSVAAAGIPARTPLGVFLVLLGAYAPSLSGAVAHRAGRRRRGHTRAARSHPAVARAGAMVPVRRRVHSRAEAHRRARPPRGHGRVAELWPSAVVPD